MRVGLLEIGFQEQVSNHLQAAAVKSRGGVVSRRREKRRAARKMKEGPSEPLCRGRLQTALSCFGLNDRGGER